MKIIDEIMPKVKAEVRLDKDNKTLWIKTDTLDGYGRVIIEDGSNWCRVFYDGKDAQTCITCKHNGTGDRECIICDNDYSSYEYMTEEQAEDYRKMLEKNSKVYGNVFEDESQTDCDKCQHRYDGTAEYCRTCGASNFQPKDEPQSIIGESFPSYITEDRTTQVLDGWQTNPRTSTTAVEDEPQTERLCDKCEYYKSGEICGHPSIGDTDMGDRGDTFPWIKETPEWCPLKPQTERSE